MSDRRGARWLRCDLHVHTSFDPTKKFGEDIRRAVQAASGGNRDLMRVVAYRFFDACINAPLHLAAVTDHNSVEGYRHMMPFYEEWRSLRTTLVADEPELNLNFDDPDDTEIDLLTIQAADDPESALDFGDLDDAEIDLHKAPVAEAEAAKGLTILPGIELTVGGERNLHVLLIASLSAPGECSEAVEWLEDYLVALFEGRRRHDEKGRPESCQRSLVNFLRFTRDRFEEARRPYLLIPAHINRSAGIDRELRSASNWLDELRNVLKERAFAQRGWAGFQVRGDPKAIPDFDRLMWSWAAAFFYGSPFDALPADARSRIQQRKRWPVLEASDPSCLGDVGKSFTWMKMELPDVEGIRLALLDPESRLRSMAEGKPREEGVSIRRLQVEHTDFFESLEVRFSGSLTALIGGRGSGKSTAIECLRYALERDRAEDFEADEQDVSAAVRAFLTRKRDRDFGERKGILLPDHCVSVDVTVAGREYRIIRSQQGTTVVQDPDEPTEQTAPLDVRTLLAPRILSQHQIALIARDPRAQRRELDALAGSGFARDFEERFREHAAELERLQASRRRLGERANALPVKETELVKVQDQLEFLERGGNKAILQQRNAYKKEEDWLNAASIACGETADGLEEAAGAIDARLEKLGQCPEGPSLAWSRPTGLKVQSRLGETASQLRALAGSVRMLAKEVSADRQAKWVPAYTAALKAYSDLQQEMLAKGVEFKQHEPLLQKRALLQREIEELRGMSGQIAVNEEKLRRQREAMVTLRLERLERRRELAQELAAAEADVSIEVHAFGDRDEFCSRRETWAGGANLHQDDWKALADYVFSAEEEVPQRMEALVAALREDVRATAEKGDSLLAGESALRRLLGDGATVTGHLFNALRRSDRLNLDAMERYLPEDAVKARVRDAQGIFKPIEQGSIGLRSTAVLSLVLAAGDQPLIIDQPEDDLDNQYIYNVVVELLRKGKFKRQIIVSTHNPNIPVNGDAEMIVALGVEEGLGRVEAAGSIDRSEVKDEVSRIMEGSAEAFRLRWERYGY